MHVRVIMFLLLFRLGRVNPAIARRCAEGAKQLKRI